jgi:hypothetical protein
MPITREQAVAAVRHDWVDEEWEFVLVVEDVLRIVNEGKKYPDRGDEEDYRIPEDISTGIARRYFGVDAYKAGS